jgi:hypothetical protein
MDRSLRTRTTWWSGHFANRQLRRIRCEIVERAPRQFPETDATPESVAPAFILEIERQRVADFERVASRISASRQGVEVCVLVLCLGIIIGNRKAARNFPASYERPLISYSPNVAGKLLLQLLSRCQKYIVCPFSFMLSGTVEYLSTISE